MQLFVFQKSKLLKFKDRIRGRSTFIPQQDYPLQRFCLGVLSAH